MQLLLSVCLAACLLALNCLSQVTTGEILGVVLDPSGAAVADARVVVRNLDTNATREITSGVDGRFRFPQLPVGSYQLTAEKLGFARYVQGPIVLRLNQDADLQIKLEVASVAETVIVAADAPLINTTNAEVGVNFDTRRVSELPLAPNRNVLNLALSVAGVSQLQSGQSEFAAGTNFSVNGMRLRSNNFMIDGQDSNDPSITGLTQQINNPDIVAEFRLVTNQFAPEFGRAAGSVVNIITKSGTNVFHGSAFWFHNDNHLNSRSNLDKAPVGTPPRPKFASAPFRIENQFGGTVGGPVIKNKTFFFGSLQRWTDRQLGSGTTIRGVPTEEGRSLLTSLAGSRATVKALLENLPAAQAPLPGVSAPLTVGGQSVSIPLGTLSGSSSIKYNNWQWSARLDHQFTDKHRLGGRYLYNDAFSSGSGQATPPGLTSIQPVRRQAASTFLNSSLSPTTFNELRLSWQRLGTTTNAQNPAVAERIPNIEVVELGLTGFNAAASRTALGLALNLPQFRFNNNYQVQETLGMMRGPHSLKFGIDFRRQDVVSFFVPNTRGRLAYNTLQDLVDDVAQTGSINLPLPGGQRLNYYKYYDRFFFVQDEWRVRPSFTITYGVRYECPGNPIDNLREANARIVAAAGGDPGYRLEPVPGRDNNNWAPRFGFNYRFEQGPGPLRWITGEGQLVLRGGYSRTYDFAFINIGLNIFSAFPFMNVVNLPARTSGSLDRIRAALVTAPPIPDPYQITRTIVGHDFRSPYAEQFALQFERELKRDWALTIGYVGTKGTALYQSVDGNPTVPGSRAARRVDPARGVIRLRCNCTSSIYRSMQTSLEKRLSRGFSMGAHYTWSAYIDGASEIFNPSNSGEVAVSQDSFNRRADRGRASYDRPHRFTANAVYELPFFSQQKGVLGKALGGWQASPFLTMQSGAPFTALDGADPGFRLSGIDALIGNAIRANLNTPLDLARMSVEEMLRAGGARLFSRVTADRPLGNLGRNILRSDGIANLDIGFIKNTRVTETHTLQFRAEFYNFGNTRNFGIPESRVSSANFLNQWGQDGGNRRIVLGLRYTF